VNTAVDWRLERQQLLQKAKSALGAPSPAGDVAHIRRNFEALIERERASAASS